MMTAVAETANRRQVAAVMLTGDQISAARRLCGIARQADLAKLADVSVPTVARAELARSQIPGMGTDAMAKIIGALEAAGIEFYLENGAHLAGGVGMRKKAKG